MKTILIAALLGSTALAGAAYAQDMTEPVEPAAQTEESTTPDAEVAPEQDQAVSGDPEQQQGGFLVWQDQEQMIASNLMGANIWGANDESIGNVDDLLLDRDGSVIAVIVGIGGFLGIGEKSVAIASDQLEFVLSQDMQAADGAPAADPAAAPVQDPAAPIAQTDPMAPAPDAAAPGQVPADGLVPPAGGVATQPGVPATGTWGWSGAGIDHIRVNYTREQLEAAPEFNAAE